MKKTDKQKGAALLVALIMLVLITLTVITSMNLGKTSLQTVGNMQTREQTIGAAENVLQNVISNDRFINTPSTVFTSACTNSDYNTQCIDVNGDGTADVTVTLTPTPTCVEARVMKNEELDVSDPQQANCASSPPQEAFGTGSPTDYSQCANSLWQISAVATDAVTQSNATVTQGVQAIVRTSAVDTSCPN